MKINYKSYQGFSGHSSISKKYEKLALSSRGQQSQSNNQKFINPPKPQAVMTAREINTISNQDD